MISLDSGADNFTVVKLGDGSMSPSAILIIVSFFLGPDENINIHLLSSLIDLTCFGFVT
jgi:hypothetical protein